jgi:hypothetical protein
VNPTPRRPLRVVLLLVVVVILGAGCSKGASRNDASASGPTTTQLTTTTVDAHGQGVRYADCMRQNGVPHFPDPEPSGSFPDFGVDVSRDQWTKAVEACKDLQPASVDYSSKRSPAQQSAALQFAQCVRDNGVKDFPDPVQGEPLIDTNKIPSSNTNGGMAILNAATKKCGARLNANANAGSQP